MRRNPVPPPIVQDEDMAMRSAVQLLTRLVAAQAQRQVGTSVGHVNKVISARVRDFINLDPPVFTGSNKDADPQDFIDRMQRTLREIWELSKGTNASPAVWEEFSGAFLCHYLPAEIRQARVDRFLTLKQGDMSVREYSLQFDSLARYAPSIVAEMSDRVHRFVVRLGPHLINECFMAVLLDGMDISRIQAYAQNLEDRKRKQYENPDGVSVRTLGLLGDLRIFCAILCHHTLLKVSDSCRSCIMKDLSILSQGSNVCYTCGDPSHYMRDCPINGRSGMVQPTRSITVSSSLVRPQERGPQASAGRGRGRSRASSSGGSQNRIYALAGHQDPEATPNDVRYGYYG
uniref:CCHC-type domain-containing protein n=1 Tax=Nicotiana tabacum TaxID=4097 RepID=A0A1S4BSW7_TOBAC|nr:PREDICTED: uncharacterized protein LOC107811539 [Nicotiana tabacum]